MKIALVLLALVALAGTEANPTIFKHGKKVVKGPTNTEPEYTNDDKISNKAAPVDSTYREQIQQTLGIGPDAAEYAARTAAASAPPVEPANPKGLEQVSDYVDLMQVKEQEKKNAVMLQVDSATFVNRGIEKEGYDTAQLVSNLEDSMQHLAKDEKRVGKDVDTVFVSLSSRSFKPESPPSELPKNLRSAFHKAAKNYELQFQKHFASPDALPHPISYLQPHHSNTILLESTTVATTGKAAVTTTKAVGDGNVNAGASATSAGSDSDPSGLIDDSGTTTGFLDPYAYVTPATLGTQAGTPTGMMGAQYGAEYANPGGIMAIQNPVAAQNYHMGVQAPPPPVRPDGLPPVPYIQPDADLIDNAADPATLGDDSKESSKRERGEEE